eukprot:scaffold89291_cov31-Attheya_sp.AAC.1
MLLWDPVRMLMPDRWFGGRIMVSDVASQRVSADMRAEEGDVDGVELVGELVTLEAFLEDGVFSSLIFFCRKNCEVCFAPSIHSEGPDVGPSFWVEGVRDVLLIGLVVRAPIDA